jgi:hypothetical protein
MTPSESQRLAAMLRQSLELLALPALQQAAWLRERSMDISDELALQFDDDYRMASQLQRAGVLSAETVALLSAVDRIFDDMDGDEATWSLSALSTDERWQRVRSVAAAALESLHVPA